MSFEVYLQFFEDRKPAGVSESQIRQLFPVDENESEPTYWHVFYDEYNSCKISVSPLESNPLMVEAAAVLRPCADERLWNSLFSLMCLGNGLLYFPGMVSPLVADDSTVSHLPKEIVDGIGIPTVIDSGQQVIEAIKNA